MHEAEVIVIVVILGIAVVFCAFGWAVSYNSTKALLMYMKQSGFKIPDKKEIKKFSRMAAMHTLLLGQDDSDQILNK